jgi:hypothetical protein
VPRSICSFSRVVLTLLIKSVMQRFNSQITTVSVENSKDYSATEGEHIIKLDCRIAKY